MEFTDDIDYTYVLRTHGWSTCLLCINSRVYEMVISHAFGDPLADFIAVLIGLMEGKNELSFIWYGEPGGVTWLINRKKEEKHKALFILDEFSESYGEEIKQLDRFVAFEMKIQQFVLIGYFQMKKLFFLLKEKKYAESRKSEFPFDHFKELETLIETKYEIWERYTK